MLMFEIKRAKMIESTHAGTPIKNTYDKDVLQAKRQLAEHPTSTTDLHICLDHVRNHGFRDIVIYRQR